LMYWLKNSLPVEATMNESAFERTSIGTVPFSWSSQARHLHAVKRETNNMMNTERTNDNLKMLDLLILLSLFCRFL